MSYNKAQQKLASTHHNFPLFFSQFKHDNYIVLNITEDAPIFYLLKSFANEVNVVGYDVKCSNQQ